MLRINEKSMRCIVKTYGTTACPFCGCTLWKRYRSCNGILFNDLEDIEAEEHDVVNVWVCYKCYERAPEYMIEKIEGSI